MYLLAAFNRARLISILRFMQTSSASHPSEYPDFYPPTTPMRSLSMPSVAPCVPPWLHRISSPRAHTCPCPSPGPCRPKRRLGPSFARPRQRGETKYSDSSGFWLSHSPVSLLLFTLSLPLRHTLDRCGLHRGHTHGALPAPLSRAVCDLEVVYKEPIRLGGECGTDTTKA